MRLLNLEASSLARKAREINYLRRLIIRLGLALLFAIIHSNIEKVYSSVLCQIVPDTLHFEVQSLALLDVY